MIVSKFIFYALLFGVPVAIFLVGFILSALFKAKGIKLFFLFTALILAGGFYTYFEFAVKLKSYAIYTASACDAGGLSYHMPLGDDPLPALDNTPSDTNRDFAWTRTIIANETSSPLSIAVISYTSDDTQFNAAGTAANYDGYVIPAGEVHMLDLEQQHIYFLEDAPESLNVDNVGNLRELLKFEVNCAG